MVENIGIEGYRALMGCDLCITGEVKLFHTDRFWARRDLFMQARRYARDNGYDVMTNKDYSSRRRIAEFYFGKINPNINVRNEGLQHLVFEKLIKGAKDHSIF